MKKTTRKAPIRPDESRPSKRADRPEGAAGALEASEIPAYRGEAKAEGEKARPRARRGDRVKPPLDLASARRPRRRSKDVELGEQRPRTSGRAAGRREQYVRLRIRVRDGRLSIVDSHLVDGPLGQETGFPGSNAYEVTLGDRLLHAGSLPDLGVQRSFPNPEGPRSQHGHYVTERSAYEFTARVPADELTPEAIGKIRVVLHRVKQEARADRLDEAPLATQFARELRPVAELVGLPDSVLPAAIEKRGGGTPAV